jgi:hypothetical protein
VGATPIASDLPEAIGATATTPPAPTGGFVPPSLIVEYQKGTAPANSTGNPIRLDGYVQGVMRSYGTVWAKTIQQVGLQAPDLTYDVTSGADRYVSLCKKNGQRVVVTRSYGKLFYCPDDGLKGGSGAIALPADVLGKLWTQAPRKTADLAGAISATRQAGLILTTWMSSQGALPSPSPTTRLYAGMCMSGAWAHGVYAQGYFTDKELQTALSLSLAIPSETNGQALPTSPGDMQAMTAWTAGFRTGDAGSCLITDWQR